MEFKKLKTSNFNLPTLSDIELPLAVKNLLKLISLYDKDIYLIGGFVRDLFLVKKSMDLDFIVIDQNGIDFAKGLAEDLGGTVIVLDESVGTARLVLKDELSLGYSFDFTGVDEKKLFEDFERRDFTFNALAINLKEPEYIIDLFSGIEDLKFKRIKEIKLKNLSDDPLRFLRAFRFASLINGDISEGIKSYIKENISLFDESISSERISSELWKILDHENSAKYIKEISDIGLFEKIFPELSPMRKVTPNDHHHLWLYDHSLELVNTLEKNFYKIPDWAKEELNKPFGHLDSPLTKSVIKLGCIFHDVGKPETWEVKDVKGVQKHTFIGHDKVGSEMVKSIGERLKFSNSIIHTLAVLVRYHLRPFQLSNNNAPISDRALFRFFRDLGEEIPRLLMLALADLHATLGPKITKEDIDKNENLILSLFDQYKVYVTKQKEIASKPKLLDGNEIMEITGVKPSKKLGELIEALDEAISVGEIKTKDEAISWIKNSK